MATYRQFDFNETIAALQKKKEGLPQQIANHAVKFFVAGFQNQGFTDLTLNKWAEVKRRIEGTAEYKYPKNKDLARRNRDILLGQTRNLLKAVNNSYRSANWEEIRLGIGKEAPYAKYINEGTEHMPARKIIGNSAVLEAEISEKLRKAILSSLKK